MGGAARGLAALSCFRPAHRTRRPQSARSRRRPSRCGIHPAQAPQLSARPACRRTLVRWLENSIFGVRSERRLRRAANVTNLLKSAFKEHGKSSGPRRIQSP